MLDAVLMAIAALPVTAIGIAALAARRERQRCALRRCPVCGAGAMVRASPRPPRDEPRYRRAAIAFRCGGCGVELFELVRPRLVAPLTGDQLDTWLVAGALPVARLHRR
jgi:hypothetical protein